LLCALAALGCAALGSGETAAGALAAAAGTAFEAAPFLLFARILGPRLGGLTHLGGCGCSRGALPGALALPAIALCALTFGPLPTVARTIGALMLVLAARRAGPGEPSQRERSADLFVDLERLVASAFLASLAASALAAYAHAIPLPLAFLAGLGLGALAPCATAGVAIAAAFAHGEPAIAFGALCTSGLVSQMEPRNAARTPERPRCDARLAHLALACALGWLALRGPSGLVSPRLLLPIGFAAVAAVATVPGAKSRSRASALVPLLMLGALVAPPRPPVDRADATRLDDAFAGEALAFSGVASTGRTGHTMLTRYVITCCRLDASPASVRLDRRLIGMDGRWIAATGTLEAAAAGTLDLRTRTLHTIPAPDDPFVYL
jgi:hypothetical protein